MRAADIARAFLHGLTGAGLFRKLTYPGAPEEFVDSRSVEELEQSGEFLEWICTVRPDLSRGEIRARQP
jgi:hypothetical protein